MGGNTYGKVNMEQVKLITVGSEITVEEKKVIWEKHNKMQEENTLKMKQDILN